MIQTNKQKQYYDKGLIDKDDILLSVCGTIESPGSPLPLSNVQNDDRNVYCAIVKFNLSKNGYFDSIR